MLQASVFFPKFTLSRNVYLGKKSHKLVKKKTKKCRFSTSCS